jgi:hypothetical protein
MQIPSLDRVTEKLQDSFDKGINAINQNARQLKDLDLGRVGESVQTINRLAKNALTEVNDSITNASSTLEKSLETFTKQADRLNQTISQEVQTAIDSSFSKWGDSYPLFVWATSHPTLAIALGILILLLLSGLIAAVSRITEKLWVFIFTSPFKLIAFIWRLFLTVFSNIFHKDREKRKNLSQTKTQIKLVLNRLEANKQEHNLLMQELEVLLNSK